MRAHSSRQACCVGSTHIFRLPAGLLLLLLAGVWGAAGVHPVQNQEEGVQTGHGAAADGDGHLAIAQHGQEQATQLAPVSKQQPMQPMQTQAQVVSGKQVNTATRDKGRPNLTNPGLAHGLSIGAAIQPTTPALMVQITGCSLKDALGLPTYLPGVRLAVDHYTVQSRVVVQTSKQQRSQWQAVANAGQQILSPLKQLLHIHRQLASKASPCGRPAIEALTGLYASMSGLPINNITISCSQGTSCAGSAVLDVVVASATPVDLQQHEVWLSRGAQQQYGYGGAATLQHTTSATMVRGDEIPHMPTHWSARDCDNWAAVASQSTGSAVRVLRCSPPRHARYQRLAKRMLVAESLAGSQPLPIPDAAATTTTAEHSAKPPMGIIGGAVAVAVAMAVSAALYLVHVRGSGCCGPGFCGRQPKTHKPGRRAHEILMANAVSKARGMGGVLGSHNPLFTSGQRHAAPMPAAGSTSGPSAAKPAPPMAPTPFQAAAGEPLPSQNSAETPTRLPVLYLEDPCPGLFSTASWAAARSSGCYTRSRCASSPSSDGPLSTTHWTAALGVEAAMFKVNSSSGMGASFTEAKSWSQLDVSSSLPQDTTSCSRNELPGQPRGLHTMRVANPAIQSCPPQTDGEAGATCLQSPGQMPLHLAVWPSGQRDVRTQLLSPRSSATTPNRSPPRQHPGPVTCRAFYRRYTWDPTCYAEDGDAQSGDDTSDANLGEIRRQSARLAMPEPAVVCTAREVPCRPGIGSQKLTGPRSAKDPPANMLNFPSSPWQLLSKVLDASSTPAPPAQPQAAAPVSKPQQDPPAAVHEEVAGPGSTIEPPSMKDLPTRDNGLPYQVPVVQRSRLNTSQLTQGSFTMLSDQQQSSQAARRAQQADVSAEIVKDVTPRAAPPKRSLIHAHVQKTGQELLQRVQSTPTVRHDVGGRGREPLTTAICELLPAPQQSLDNVSAVAVQGSDGVKPPSDTYLHEAIKEQQLKILGRTEPEQAASPRVNSVSNAKPTELFASKICASQQAATLQAGAGSRSTVMANTYNSTHSRCSSNSRATMDLTPVMRRDPTTFTSNQTTSQAVSVTSAHVTHTYTLLSTSVPTASQGVSQQLPCSDDDDETRFIREVEAAAKAIADGQMFTATDDSQDGSPRDTRDKSSWTELVSSHFNTWSSDSMAHVSSHAHAAVHSLADHGSDQATAPVSAVVSGNRHKLQLDRGSLMCSYRTAMRTGKSSYSSSISEHPTHMHSNRPSKRPVSQGQHRHGTVPPRHPTTQQ